MWQAGIALHSDDEYLLSDYPMCFYEVDYISIYHKQQLLHMYKSLSPLPLKIHLKIITLGHSDTRVSNFSTAVVTLDHKNMRKGYHMMDVVCY